MPGNVISLPGTTCCGSLIHASNVLSSQTMFDDLKAGEYRVKLGRLPAFLFHKLARLGPVIFRSGWREWQAAHAPNMRWPCVGFAFWAWTNVPAAMSNGGTKTMANRRSAFIDQTP